MSISAAPPEHDHEHGHSHGLVDASITRSLAGIRAVLISLGVLGVAALAQTLIFALSGSLALLADLDPQRRRRPHRDPAHDRVLAALSQG